MVLEKEKEIVENKIITRAEKPLKLNKATSFNLKNALEKKEIVEEVNAEKDKNLPRDTFTYEDVIDYWSEFLVRLKEEGNIPSYNALHTTVVSQTKASTVLFTFGSSSSQTEFNLYKDRIINEMRETFNHYYITVLTEIKEDTSARHVYSKEDIFKEMLKKNPLLNKLKDELGLDLYD